MTAIIFDLDGTLLNSLDDLGNAMNTTLTHFGYPTHPMESYKTFVGNGLSKLCERALGEQQEHYDTVLAHFLDVYGTQESVAQVYPNVMETLKELNRLEIPIAIHTNKMQRFTDVIISEIFSDIQFYDVIGDREDGHRKPSAVHTRKLIEALPEPKKVFFVGDSDVDMFTAINAEAVPVGVSWGFRSIEQLEGAGAHIVIHDMKDLLDVIK